MTGLMERAVEQSTIGRWYRSLASNERRAVSWGAVVLGLVVAYVAIWQPAFDYRQTQVERYLLERASNEWMRANEAEARKQGGAGPQSGEVNIAKISGSARQFGIPLQRFQPIAGGGVSVQLQRQPFNEILRWLEALREQHGFRVVQASIDADAEGLVNARFSIR